MLFLRAFALLLAMPLSTLAQTMYFGDESRLGRPYSKDPHVVAFQGRYLMYFSIPPSGAKEGPTSGWGIGVAESRDLTHWKTVATLQPDAPYEAKGLCAPSARVIDGQVHLFYQTYGNGRRDALCHAWSADGLTFTRNPTNPIFSPTGDWTCGRAIDAELFTFKDQHLLYFATRDTSYQVQMQGVAAAPRSGNFDRDQWKQLTNYPILKPELPWEKKCIEAASIIQKGKYLYMFYAGGFNNEPQQIGVARSRDGVRWKRLSKEPFLPNGAPGTWNESESGHPHIFEDTDGRTYLFFQGNNDKGKTWYLSQVEVEPQRALPGPLNHPQRTSPCIPDKPKFNS